MKGPKRGLVLLSLVLLLLLLVLSGTPRRLNLAL